MNCCTTPQDKVSFTPTNHPELRQYLGYRHPITNIGMITRTVADDAGVHIDAIKSRMRGRPLPDLRKICYFYCRKLVMIAPGVQVPLKKIGEYFDRDHSSIIYSIAEYESLYRHNNDFRKMAISAAKAIETRLGLQV